MFYLISFVSLSLGRPYKRLFQKRYFLRLFSKFIDCKYPPKLLFQYFCRTIGSFQYIKLTFIWNSQAGISRLIMLACERNGNHAIINLLDLAFYLSSFVRSRMRTGQHCLVCLCSNTKFISIFKKCLKLILSLNL